MNNISNNMKKHNQLINELQATYHDSSVKMGISDSVSLILYALCDGDGSCPLNDICRYTSLSKQTVNSAIRNLEKQNIVYLESINGKSKMVYLTEEGKEFANKTVMKLMKFEDEIISSWSKEDLEKFIQLTERYLVDLREKVKEL